jgi:aminopeptidase-like protein
VNNLQLVNYSTPINLEIEYEELLPHLHTLPNMADAIPYHTSYYKKNWGFCITHNELLQLPKNGKYKVFIDSELKQGSMSYADLVLEGESEKEILFSTYLCHPSMANNELSGPLVLAFLYQKIAAMPNRNYTYRFVFAPETIGAINYLSVHGEHLQNNLLAGYVLTCIGDAGNITYKRSRKGNTNADLIAEHILKYSSKKFNTIPFTIGGSDERQYCSPGFNLPVGSIMRTPYQTFDEYHTSKDNKDLMRFDLMMETINTIYNMVEAHELNKNYFGSIQHCEPNLGKRGLYDVKGASKVRGDELTNRLHLLNCADGLHSMLEIAELSNKSILDYKSEIELLTKNDLIKALD